jgi:hypothetical protein
MKTRALLHSTMLASLLLAGAVSHSPAQTTERKTAQATPIAASAPTVVPALVPYSGIAVGGDGKAISGEASVTFLIYKDEQGGEPFFAETQTVAVDPVGHYTAQLGASLASGIPIDLFGTGEARWLEVQVAGLPPQPRVLLASVPYALKSGDAATLGGLPASAFALAGPRVTTGAVPETMPTATDVTTPGGVSGYLSEFSGANTIVDSPVFVLGANVGIGTGAPTSTLDVNGTEFVSGLLIAGGGTFVGPVELAPVGTATATTSYSSQYLKIYSSAYNSTSKAVVNPRFEWEANVTGNNTAAPSATLSLLSSITAGNATETGFYFNADGTINFSPKQTFPAATFSGPISTSSAAANGDALSGTSTGVDGIGVSGNGAGNGGYGVTGIANGSAEGISQPVGVLGYSSSGYGMSANTGSGTALYSAATTGQAGYFTSAFGGPTTYETVTPVEGASVAIYNTYDAENAGGNWNGTTPQGLYVESDGYNGTGILGTVTNGGIGIWGLNGEGSNTAGFLRSYVNAAGLWGDTVEGYDGNPGFYGVVGSTDNNTAGYFENNSTEYTTLQLYNIAPSGSAGTGAAAKSLFKTLQASTVDGTCGFGEKGNLTCTGQVKTLATTSKSRMVETYAMQSPENWMEDFGSATLTNGVATVAIDPAFAETVSANAEYHVFLTPNGDSKGLYVTAKSATSFEVHESGGGSSSLAFDYRIVAKRLGHEGERLVDVTERFHAETAETAKHFQAASAHPNAVRTARPATRALPAPRIPQMQPAAMPPAKVADLR